MAMVDRTRELEALASERRPIGWDGLTAAEMLAESERRFAQTGSYYALTGELELKSGDPIRYESSE